MAYLSETEDAPRMTRAVQVLIAITVAIYFLQVSIVQPADVATWLAFDRGDLTGSLWSVATYVFVHGDFFHVFFNMLLLWQFGPRVEHQWGAGKFVGFYFWCALGGVLGHLMFGGSGILLGASAAVLGVLLAYAMRWPDDELLLFMVFPVKVKYAVMLMAAIDLLSGMWMLAGLGSSRTAYFAHLGGLAFAWFYLRTPSAQSLDRLRQRISPVADVPDEPPRAVPKSLPRPRDREERSSSDEAIVRSKAMVAKRPAPPPPQRTPRDPKADALNSVLDKISATGIGSLTADERKLLEEMSRKLRGPS